MRSIALAALCLGLLHAADSDLGGRFTGEWKSNSAGVAGTFRLQLEPAAGGTWKAEVSFTLGGEDVKTTVREVRVEKDRLEAAYDFDLQGNSLRSRIRGQWDGKAFAGEYHTTTVDGSAAVDDGTWTAARGK